MKKEKRNEKCKSGINLEASKELSFDKKCLDKECLDEKCDNTDSTCASDDNCK